MPHDWRPAFLLELAHTGNVSAAAAKAGIDRDTAYMARDPSKYETPASKLEAETFGKQWATALETATDALELEARRRALEGVNEPVGWYRGEAGGTVQRYSDTLMIFLLKAHRPEKFGDTTRNVNVNVTAEELARMDDAELDRLIDTLARRA